MLGALSVWLNYQAIADRVNFWIYEPPAAIAEIVKNTKMTEEGKFAFYTAQPRLDGTRAFNANCDRKEENTAILGCYALNKIFIYDVTDERLEGIEEVTAVHEMLHVLYQRLHDSDKARLNTLLEAEFVELKKDKEFTERMDFYERTEPGEKYNELHSIVATEVSNISDELESYYAKYFDRPTILKLFRDYKNEFKKLETQADQIKSRLDVLTVKVDKAKDAYADDIKDLDRDIQAFNQKAESGAFNTQSEFDAERQELINRADQLKTDRTAINKMVDEYNALIKEHNKIITESNALYQSIDSSVAPAPSI
jgi:hypothetical protein